MTPVKILNISTIVPLKGLGQENDIVLRVQDYLRKKYGYHFQIVKSLPYTPNVLSKLNSKWAQYRELQVEQEIDLEGYRASIYPWVAPPSSRLLMNYPLIPINWIFFKLKLQKRLSSWAESADLYVAQNTIPDSLLAYWLHRQYGKPYIVNIRRDFAKSLTSLPPFRRVFRHAKAIITHSPTNYVRMKGSIDLSFVPHPVNSEFFSTEENDYSVIRLVSVCRLLSLKNLDLVIRTLASLNNKGYEFEYHIAGDGPERFNLEMLANESGLSQKVVFHGHQNQKAVVRLLKQSHIFLMPSYPETLGRAFLEAAASGCLCIGHENTGIDGLFTHRESALFVNSRTIEDELEHLFSNFSPEHLEAYLRESRRITGQLTWDKIGAEYDAIYRKACSPPERIRR